MLNSGVNSSVTSKIVIVNKCSFHGFGTLRKYSHESECICISLNTSITFLAQQKQDESLLEDVWTLLRAGRLEEACDLCRSAGQVNNVLDLLGYGLCLLVLF